MTKLLPLKTASQSSPTLKKEWKKVSIVTTFYESFGTEKYRKQKETTAHSYVKIVSIFKYSPHLHK